VLAAELALALCEFAALLDPPPLLHAVASNSAETAPPTHSRAFDLFMWSVPFIVVAVLLRLTRTFLMTSIRRFEGLQKPSTARCRLLYPIRSGGVKGGAEYESEP
jgi:hypothetical protein